MKCVRLNDKTIIRVNNGRAAGLVDGKKGSYCPKKVYKKYLIDKRR